MPRYDYNCECGNEFESINSIDNRHTCICPICNKNAKLVFSMSPNINTGSWVEGWYNDLDKKPIYIHNKEHLKSECDKRGLVANCLMSEGSTSKELYNKI